MLCLSGFELYSRWVPLNYVKRTTSEKALKIPRANEFMIKCCCYYYFGVFTFISLL